MRSLGICTLRRHVDELNHEKRRLYDEARERFDAVLLIDPREVAYAFVRGEPKPGVTYRGQDISALTTLIVRSTSGIEASTAMLVRTLDLCGCDIFDPLDRFSVGRGSKLLTTLTRFRSGVGTSTYVSFSRDAGLSLLHRLADQGRFPLVVKPAAGRKGRGVHIIHDFKAGLERLDEHFALGAVSEDPFFLQDLVVIETEYRILVVDGQALGIVAKERTPGGVAANAAQGTRFVAADAPHVVQAALPHVSDEGILGVDVAVDTKGNVHVIETNRAPEWEAFERASGLNVARLVIERAIQRLQSGAP